MNQDSFGSFMQAAVARIVQPVGQIGCLRLTQSVRPGSAELKLREPEMRHAFCLEAEKRGICFGVEVPTRRKYRFTKAVGKNRRSALHDLALFDQQRAEPDVLLELKQAQPAFTTDADENITDAKAISKDFQKLFAETALSGKCVFHILQASDLGTMPNLLGKYVPAIEMAHAAAEQFHGVDILKDETWFCLVILILRDRRSHPPDQPRLMTYCCRTWESYERRYEIRQAERWAATPC